ncbi:MAG: outer membrane protein assembly factor BamA [Rikenellaceae bacterium]
MSLFRFFTLSALFVILPMVGAKAQAQELSAEGVDSLRKIYQDAPMLKSDDPMLKGEPKPYKISKVDVHGATNIYHELIRSSSGLIVGDSIYLSSDFVSSVISKLWAQRLYDDIEVGAVIDGQEVAIDLFLSERPRVLNWAFEGVSRSRIRALTDDLALKRNTELSDYVIDKNTKHIKDFMIKKGYRNTDVSIRVTNDTIREHMVNVTFVIDQKEKLKIKEIVFEGNDAFEDKRLRKTFKGTSQKSWNIFKSKKLKDDEYEEDKLLLLDFYNSKGYRNAVVLRDSIYQIDEKNIGITLDVDEGNKFYIRNVSWVGNSIYTTEQLEAMFGVKPGDTYDKKSMHRRLGVGRENNPQETSVSTLYQNSGYLASRIEPSEIIIGADSIDMEVKIFEGRPFTVNNITITGNNRIDDEVIRRELYTRPGELYNQALLMQTLQVLGTMGHFNPETLSPNINPVNNELVDIGFALEEVASDQVNISGGWGSSTFIGSVGLTLNNLSVKNFFDKGAWRPYPMGQNQKLSISAQTNGTYYKAASIGFTDPWFGGEKPNSLTVSMHYSDQNDAYYIYQTPTCYFRTVGVAAGIGQRLSIPDPYFSIYNELSYTQYRLKDWSWGGSYLFSDGSGTANMVSFKSVFSRNSVDQQTYPRRGSEFTVSLQITPPFSLMDGVDYEDDDLSDAQRYKWIEFHKWQAGFKWYQTLSRNEDLVLMLSADLGYVGYYNENKVSPFELYDVGGDGMTGYSMYGVDIISLRGYEDGALNPSTSSYSQGYNKYCMELRYPVVMEQTTQIYALVFAEAGNGFDSWANFSPFDVKRSAGIGIRLNLPMIGMLGVDWGYGFDKTVGSSTVSGSQFHFVLGQQF